MAYEGDAFISYAHIDNRALGEGRTGWVANFQRALETRVAQFIGRDARVWWDPELRGNDDFSDILIDRLRKVAALVSVVSPGYVNSKWGRRELAEFCRVAEEQGGLQISDKARVFKVLKTPVPLNQHPPELQPFLGYEFYKVEPDSGRVRELSEMFGPEAEQEFWIRLDDLAHDMCRLLELVDQDHAAAFIRPDTGGAVFLAETTSDLKAERDALKRALHEHGITVLPARTLPLSEAEVTAAVREDLAVSRMSIHLFGRTYGLVPEGAEASLPEIQNDLAAARTASGSFSRLLWIPNGLQVIDDRQQRVLDLLRRDQRMQPRTDLLETSLEDLRTMIATRLAETPKAAARGSATAASSRAETASLYLIYDQRDERAITPWADLLFTEFEVVHSMLDGDEKDVRESHEEALRTCDGVLLFAGAANEAWLRRKLNEVQKSPGYGRTKGAPEVCVCLIPPETPAKTRFRTHHAHVIAQWHGCDAAALEPFVVALKAKGHESAP
jgi:hypothetical protein